MADGTVKLFQSYRPGIADGEQTRDFLYVKDAVAIALHLGRTPRRAGLYNVGAGVARTWNDLARAIFTALELPERSSTCRCPNAAWQISVPHRSDDRPFARERLRRAVHRARRRASPTTCSRYLVPGVMLGAETSAVTGVPVISATR